MQEQYIIPAANLEQFKEQIEKLNRRAKRLGVEPITFATEHAYNQHEFRTPRKDDAVWIADHVIVEEEITEDSVDHMGIKTREVVGWRRVVKEACEPVPGGKTRKPTGNVREWLHLTVQGEAPKYAGWVFIATLSPLPVDDGEVVNTVHCVPGQECPAEYRERVGECDHCKTKRRRNETFVVRNEDGEHMMVGRSCLKDFLGHSDPHKLARHAEWLCSIGKLCNDATGEGWGGGGSPSCWSLEHFLTWTAAVIRRYGWLSGSKAWEEGGVATKTKVIEALCPPKHRRALSQWRKWVREMTPTEKEEKRAAEAIAWVETLEDNGEELNDYLYNLAVIGRAGVVTIKMAGFAASILVAYDKATEKVRRAQERAEAVDCPEGRLVVTGEVVRLDVKENAWGTRDVMTVRDETGFRVWGTLPRALSDADVGDKVRFTATISPSDNDPKFGFFKRPSKAELLDREQASDDDGKTEEQPKDEGEPPWNP